MNIHEGKVYHNAKYRGLFDNPRSIFAIPVFIIRYNKIQNKQFHTYSINMTGKIHQNENG